MKNLFPKKITIFYILFFIISTGIFLRILNLGKQSIWGDEARAFLRAQKSISQIWNDQVKESNPPLYDILLHYYLKSFNKRDDFIFRFFPAMFGIMIIPFAFWVGKLIFNNRVGLYFSLLLAISPYHIYYSQDAKMYSLLGLLSLVSFFFYYLSLKENQLKHWVAYVLTTVLLVYCHNYGVLFLFAEIIYFFLFGKKRSNSVKFLFSQLIILIFFIPRIACLYQQIFMDLNPWLKNYLIRDIARTFVYFSVVMRHLEITTSVIIALIIDLPAYLFIFIAAILHKTKNRDDKEKKFFLLSHLFMPLALALFISLKKPIFYTGRYDMVVFPLFSLMISYGLDKLKQNILRNVLVIFIMVTAVIILKSYYLDFKKSNDRQVDAYIQSKINKDDVLVFTNLSFHAFRYYWRGEYKPQIFPFPAIDSGSLPRAVYEDNQEYIDNEIKNIKEKIRISLNKNNRLWVMYSKDFLINKSLISELNSSYELVDKIIFEPGARGNQITEIFIFKLFSK